MELKEFALLWENRNFRKRKAPINVINFFFLSGDIFVREHCLPPVTVKNEATDSYIKFPFVLALKNYVPRES